MAEHREDECPFDAEAVTDSLIASDGTASVITNIAPIVPGHVLVIPVRHVSSLLDLTDAELGAFFRFARSATRMVVDVFNAEAFNWSLQDGSAAGQTVAHLHLHVIPRYPGDLPEPGDWYPKLQQPISNDAQGHIDSDERQRLTPQQLTELTMAIRKRAEAIGALASGSAKGPHQS